MPANQILDLLSGGDRRDIRGVQQVIQLISGHPNLFGKLINGLWHEDRLVRMRAADATEKITRTAVHLLEPFKRELLGLLAEAHQPELRWHLAAIVPRLSLSREQREFATSALYKYLEDRSSIVKTFALQALADLARDDPTRREEVMDLLREATRKGTPAMKARSRKLLLELGPG